MTITNPIHLDPIYRENCGRTDLTTTNPKNVTCTDCQYKPGLNQDHPLWPVFKLVAEEYWFSMHKHGPWQDMEDAHQATAIRNEFTEWHNAWFASDVFGDHGELAELIDLINVAAKRHVELSKLSNPLDQETKTGEVANG